jgi:hypothetical protein
MVYMPTYDEINVVSDIHMGGPHGFQILKRGGRLGALIADLATRKPDRQVALVLNGDVIDSLAEEGIDGYIALRRPERMMARIFEDPAFKPVWDGLKTFVHAPNRHLVILTGNHDIELSLPPVERAIRQYLIGDASTPEEHALRSGRITFATHGAGYGCLVGRARVFCTHGNETDTWNVVDYGQLAELGNALNSGRYVDERKWRPNAGARLVVDVMNPVKRKYPFVDLLKPENKLVVPILVVLDPGLIKQQKLDAVIGVGAEKIRSELNTRGLLSGEGENLEAVRDQAAAAATGMDALLGPNLKAHLDEATPGDRSEDALLLAAETRYHAKGNGILSVTESESDTPETLGWFGYVMDRISGKDKVEALRRALLDWMTDPDGESGNCEAFDDTFDLFKRDDTFDTITARVSDDVDFIVTGHTHLERAIDIRNDHTRFYYNSGAWIRLLRFTKYCLETPDEFRRVYDKVLNGGKMAAIDGMMIHSSKTETQPFMIDTTTMVRIEDTGDAVEGKLLHIKGGEDNVPVAAEPVVGSVFRRTP